jgi:AcrR family transcriptional regulator
MANVMSIAKSTTRRKDPSERRAEIVSVASRVAVDEGLEKVTAKRIAEELGVVPGLVNHYFPAVDDLVAASFGYAAGAERADIYGAASLEPNRVAQMRRLMHELVHPARDAVSLLWLDAWQASRRRPALLSEVAAQMNADSAALTGLIDAGIEAKEFTVDDAALAATRIISLVDGLSVQAAINSKVDYAIVAEFVLRTTEAELRLRAGDLASEGDAARHS